MSKNTIFSDSLFAMETRCDVVFTGIQQEKAEQMFQLVKNEIDQLEMQISRFIPDSQLAKLNSTGANKWLNVSNELWEILNICYDFYQMSNGAFDITVTPLINLWKISDSPTKEEIETARKLSGFDKVEFDFENRKLKFNIEGIEFDLGGIRKGLVLDTLKPILENHGIENGIMSFGESSILALGKHPNGEKWPLGIRNNYQTDEFVHIFNTTNQAVTTSGSKIISDEDNIKKGNHVISPATGLPVKVNKTVTVKSNSATLGKFLSITWLILPENDKIILSEKMKDMEILEVEYLQDDIKTKLTIL